MKCRRQAFACVRLAQTSNSQQKIEFCQSRQGVTIAGGDLQDLEAQVMPEPWRRPAAAPEPIAVLLDLLLSLNKLLQQIDLANEQGGVGRCLPAGTVLTLLTGLLDRIEGNGT